MILFTLLLTTGFKLMTMPNTEANLVGIGIIIAATLAVLKFNVKPNINKTEKDENDD